MGEITEALRIKMSTLSEQYETKMRNLLKVEEDAETVNNNMKRCEAGILKEVLIAKDPETGKPLYTNEAQRGIALQEKKDRDEQYNTLRSEYTELARKSKEITTEIDIIKHTGKNIQKIADLEVARINLLAAEAAKVRER